MNIPHYLLEAYKGYFEDDLTQDEILRRIETDSPEQRLEIYCIWNGIIGYASTLYNIATIEKYVR